MAELLIELFSEDIPARMQKQAGEDLLRLLTKQLDDNDIEYGDASAHTTLRRVALVIDGIAGTRPDVREERRGPRADAPEKAINGFLRGSGLDSLDQCEKRETKKGEFWFAVIEKKGGPTADVLPGMITTAIRDFVWPKSMRWSSTSFRWVRPLHSIIALFDGKVLDGELPLGDTEDPIKFGNTTRGHRFLSPDEITVTDFADYKAKLEKAHVLIDREERKAHIANEAEKIAADAGLKLRPDPGLLAEVCGLVEWPVMLLGSFDDAFLEVPPECLTSSMRTHQKYFAVEKADGTLAPNFIVAANMITHDGGKEVVRGNEKVINARLADAKFFWDQDRKTRLEDRVPDLKSVTFHDKLGTVADKIDRVQLLAGEIAGMIDTDVNMATRAALLAKADLTTGMVAEFTELQGIMGYYYAREEGEDDAVARAIMEHYKPQGPNDDCPSHGVSIAVAMADKVDTLVGFFGIDEKPTGSKDPYALRRAALGIIRLVVENNLRIELAHIFDNAHKHYKDTGLRDAGTVREELLGFLAERLKVVLRDQGVRHDLIDAVFAAGQDDDITRLLDRVRALQEFLTTENGENLLAAYRRASNIVRIEEKKDGTTYAGDITGDLLKQEEETILVKSLTMARERIVPALDDENFADAMAAMSELRKPVDDFFDQVTVNVDDQDLRTNRLKLLSQISSTLDQVADFSRIEG